MKTINKILLTFFLTIFILGACTDDFEEINTDPNNPTVVPAENLLTEAQFRFADRLWGRDMNFGMAMLMVQHFSQNEYAEVSRYNLNPSLYNNAWTSFYAVSLADINEAIEITQEYTGISDAVKNNRLALLTIMRVYIFQTITDLWGPVPYTQALQPDEFPNPAYDSQEVIYEGLLNEINTAIGMINPDVSSFTSGDVIYGGDMALWGKFANSLKVRLGMRMADVAPNRASTVVAEAYNHPLGVIASPAENAVFQFAADQRIANPFFVDNITRDDFAISEIVVNELSDRNDPRLGRFANTNEQGQIVGIPYGLTDAQTFLYKVNSSRPHSAIRDATSPAILLSYTEVEFFRAEAIERGIITGNAQEAFNNAVTASFLRWGLTTEQAEAYLAANPYDAANWRASIGYEKWVALYTQGIEAFAERRRLNEPSLPLPADAETTQIPVRFFYPAIEAEANAANLEAAGANELNVRLWWDVN